ncbi:quinone reductase [Penicillium chermesinum]|uniref:Quinone reductase n=1 Tax=Penicillium chermesinum TaxID=63820 RepID=A0A9W9N875_9EURO|nr:quinone reductase [Penicillium chermesinum]KAJ5215069.1 quinone reductase [Penicillium chermesinum]KAJ6141440.1 quinone reductase [Penicillium chermesinum]
MRAARVRPTSTDGVPYGFPGNVAPSSAIEVHENIPKPHITKPGELLIQVKASTVYKDNLEWNELYPPNHATLGNDFSGIVVAVHEGEGSFRVGDHVYGMTHAGRGGTWAEYAIVTTEEAAKKPDNLSWEEAAAIPGSALTADQALFRHVGLDTTAHNGQKRVLITGAAGGIGTFLVQFAVLAGHHVVAASSSNQRNKAFLQTLGAHEVVEYGDFSTLEKVDVVVDSVGAQVLADCWAVIKPDGTLLSFDACSWGFREEHSKNGISQGKEGVRALYMIAEPSAESMARITKHVAEGQIRGRVSKVVSLNDVREAYESAHFRGAGHGKIVVRI